VDGWIAKKNAGVMANKFHWSGKPHNKPKVLKGSYHPLLMIGMVDEC
jgi:hypothetical protein